jgi:hypothetical protein
MINRALVPQWPSASFVGEMAALQSIPDYPPHKMHPAEIHFTKMATAIYFVRPCQYLG